MVGRNPQPKREQATPRGLTEEVSQIITMTAFKRKELVWVDTHL
jgi:hypothetical protein